MAPKLTRDAELIRTARAVLTLQRKISKARRQIKGWQGDLKHERQMLRGLAYAAENRPDVAPSRLTGYATGYAMPARVSEWDKRGAEHVADLLAEDEQAKD